MAILNIKDLQEGQVVAKSVSVNGRVLIGQGASLTEKMIGLFKTWGVTEVEVEGEQEVDGGALENLSEAELAEIDKQVMERLFDMDAKNEVMLEIKRIMMKKAAFEYIKAKPK